MQPKEEKDPLNKFYYKYRFHLLLLLIGVLIGVIACDWSYFKLDDTISIPQIFTVLFSGGVAIYVGSTIQTALRRRQSDHDLLNDEIKRLLIFIEKLEGWLGDLVLPFEESKRYFKRGSVNILSDKKIFSPNQICKEEDFEEILGLFNSIKQGVSDISPVNGFINIPPERVEEFEKRCLEIRIGLMNLLLK